MAWQILTADGGFPAGMHEIPAAVWNDKIYITTDDEDANGRSLWSSVDGITWVEESTDGPWHKRERHSLVVFDNKLLLMGGLWKANGPDGRREYFDDIWAWDGSSWTQWGNLPVARASFTPVVFQNKLWILGGRVDDGSTAAGTMIDDIHYHNGVSWTTVQASGAVFGKRKGYGLVSITGKMVLCGGELLNADGSTTYKSDVWTSVDGLSWINVIPEIPRMLGRRDFGFSYLDGTIYAYGGKTKNGSTNDVWASTDDGLTFEFYEEAQWTPRYEFAHCAAFSKLFVIGFSSDEVWATARWVHESAQNRNPFTGKFTPRSVIHKSSRDNTKYMYLYGGDEDLYHVSGQYLSMNHGNGDDQRPYQLWRTEDGISWELVKNMASASANGSGPIVPYPRHAGPSVNMKQVSGFSFVSFRPSHIDYNRLYIIGGVYTNGSDGARIWVSDDDGDTWSPVLYEASQRCMQEQWRENYPYTDSPTASADNSATRSFHRCLVHVPNPSTKAEYVYLLGGHSALVEGYRRHNDVWRTADPEKGWEIVKQNTDSADHWSRREGHAACNFCRRMWLSGGYDGSGTIADLWSSQDGITWTEHATPPWTARTNHVMVATEGRLYVYGGNSQGSYDPDFDLNDVWSTVDGENWVQEPDAEWSIRSGGTGEFFAEKIWMICGQHGEEAYASEVLETFTVPSSVIPGLNNFNYDNASGILAVDDYFIHEGSFYRITVSTPTSLGADDGYLQFTPVLADGITAGTTISTVTREPARTVPVDDDLDIYDVPPAGGLIWSLFTKDEPTEDCRPRYDVEVFTSSDIEIDSIQVTTSKTDDLITRLVGYYHENYFKADPKKIVFSKNTRKYGIREREIDFFIYNDLETVKRVLRFWGNRKSTHWQEFRIRCFLAGVPLEIYDAIALELESNPNVFGPQALALVKELNYSPEDYSVEVIAQSAIESGTNYNGRNYWS